MNILCPINPRRKVQDVFVPSQTRKTNQQAEPPQAILVGYLQRPNYVAAKQSLAVEWGKSQELHKRPKIMKFILDRRAS